MPAKSKRPTRGPVRIPESRDLSMPPERYQPGKAEHEQEVDISGMSERGFRETLFRPFRFVKIAYVVMGAL